MRELAPPVGGNRDAGSRNLGQVFWRDIAMVSLLPISGTEVTDGKAERFRFSKEGAD